MQVPAVNCFAANIISSEWEANEHADRRKTQLCGTQNSPNSVWPQTKALRCSIFSAAVLAPRKNLMTRLRSRPRIDRIPINP
jgi:hypothetical protein